MQTCTDNDAQGVSRGVVPAVDFSENVGRQSASGGMEMQQGVYVTPRSTRSVFSAADGARPSTASWSGWMTKIGDLFKAPPVTWLPSPIPSPPRPRRLLDPRPSRGDQPGRTVGYQESLLGARVEEIRGVGRPPYNTTPSSSSLPAEAIQAEVQRQLGGLLERLQTVETLNAQLQEELESERNQTRALLSRRADPGDPGVLPQPVQVPSDDPRGLQEGAREPQGEPAQGLWSEGPYPDTGEGSSRRRADPWRDPLGALWDELQARRGGIPDASVRQPQNPGNERRESQPGGDPGVTTNAILEALTKNLVSLQEMQMKTMQRDAEVEESPEQVKNSNVVLPSLVGPEEPTAGILFQDWLTQMSIPMQDLSTSSSMWWRDVMKLVQDTYSTWLASTPLERLQLEPRGHESLITAKWTRVNSRACTLVLQSIVEAVKSDVIARRAVQSMPMILFRLHTCYQPGGASERSTVLSNLQNPVQPTTLEGALTWLRAWPRWLQRCRDLKMMVPDGSVLARALTSATTKFVNENSDTQFRTQLLRSSLRIDAQPELGDVIKYQQHLQAEVESLMSSRSLNSSTNPALKAMTPTQNPAASSTAPSTKPGCKYFVKATGCRRGPKCPYSHDWNQFTKAERSKRCLVCGSEEHRQRDCPSKQPKQFPKAGQSQATQSSPTNQTSSMTTATPIVQAMEPEKEVSPTAATSVVTGEPVWSLETLLQAAAKVAGASPSTAKAPSINVMAIRQRQWGSELGSSYALVDSGATHALRRASTMDEWEQAPPVVVRLAGGESVNLKMNTGGTILVPMASATTGSSSSYLLVPWYLSWGILWCGLRISAGWKGHKARSST